MKTSNSTQATIFLLQFDKMLAPKFKKKLVSYGYKDIHVIHSDDDALKQLKQKQFAIVIADIDPEGETAGIDPVFSILRDKDIPLIILSKSIDEETFTHASELHPWAMLFKPVNWQELRMALQNITHRFNRTSEDSSKFESVMDQQESEAKYRKLFENAPLGYQSLDPDGKLIFVNDTWCKMLNYSKSKINGKWFGDFLVDGQKNLFKKKFAEFKKEGVAANRKFNMVRGDGSIIHTTINGTAVYSDSGEFIQTHCILKDTSEQQIQEENLSFQSSLLNSVGQSVIATDAEGNITYWNRAAELLYGWKEEEVIGKPIFAITPSDDMKDNALEIMETLKKGKVWKGEFRVRRKDGSEFTASVTDTPIYDENGELIGIIGISEDISEKLASQRKLAESEERFRLLFETSGFGIGYYDIKGRMLKLNNIAAERLGGKPEDFTGKTMRDLFGKEAKRYIDRLDLAIERKKIFEYIDKVELPIGQKWYSSVYCPLITEEGSVKGIQVASYDITDQKQTEQDLMESQDFMTRIGKMARVGGWGVNLDTKEVYWSEVVKDIHEVPANYEPNLEEALGFYPGQSGDQLASAVGKAIENGKPYDLELEFISANGRKKWVRTIGNPVMKKGKCVSLSGTFQDITENKRSRIELMKLNEELAKHKLILDQILDNTLDHTYIMDKEANIIYASKSGAEANGLDQQEMIKKNFKVLDISNDDIRQFEKNLESTLKSKVARKDTMAIQSQDSNRYLEYVISPLVELDGSVDLALSISRDITDRQRIENELRKTSRELALLNVINSAANNNMETREIADLLSSELRKKFNIYGASLFMYDRDKNRLFSLNNSMSPDDRDKVEKIMGSKIPAIRIDLKYKGRHSLCLSQNQVLYTEDQDEIIQIAGEFTQNKALRMFIPAVIRQLKLKSVMLIPLYKDKVPIGLMEISDKTVLSKEVIDSIKKISDGIANIFSRKLSESDLAAKEEDYRLLFNNSPNAIVIVDKNMNIKSFNDTLVDLCGFSREEILQNKLYDLLLIPESEIKDLRMASVKVLKGKQVKPVEFQWTNKDKNKRWAESQFSIIPKDRSEIQIVITDTTKQKAALEQLRYSEENLRVLAEASPVGIYRTDPSGNCIYVNPQWLKMANMTQAEAMGNGWINAIYEEDRDWVITDFAETVSSGSSWSREYRFCGSGKAPVWVHGSAAKMLDEEGNVLGYVGSNLDISERKIAEQTILEERDRSSQYLNIAASIIIALDAKGDITLLNDGGVEILECPRKKALGMNWFDNFLPMEHKKEVKKVFHELLNDNKEPVEYYENQIITGKGKLKTLRWHNSLIRNASGQIIGLLSSGEDVTERKNAEIAFKESEERYKDLVEKSGVAILVDDVEGNIIYYNRDFAKLFGYTFKETADKTKVDLIHEEDVSIVKNYHNRRMEGKKVPQKYELRGRRKDGSVIWIEVKATSLRESGAFKGTRNYFWDITERKSIETALAESEEKFRELFSRMSSGGVIYKYDPEQEDFIISDMNDKGLKISGLLKADIIMKPIKKYFPGVEESGLWEVFEEVYNTGKSSYHPVSNYNDERLELYVENRVYKLSSGEIVAIFDDITERIRAEVQLRKNYEQIASLSRHIEEVREQERLQIARNLHDDLGQLLTALKMDLSWIRNQVPEKPKELISRSNSALEIINHAISSVQTISSDLRPPVLENLGLLESLSGLSIEFQARNKIDVDLAIPDKLPSMDLNMEISIYRIIQECFTNVVRHACASKVNLSMRIDNNTLYTTVQDDGVGIPNEKLTAKDSYGLISMKERTLRWNGKFSISSYEGNGTAIMFEIALP